MARNEASADAAHMAVRLLVAAKIRLLVPMAVIYLVSYIGLTIVAGFGKSSLSIKVAGPLNLGFALIAANYGLSWALALVYERIANRVFDPLASKIKASRQEAAA